MTTLKDMRTEMGMTQRDVAKELGITPSFYSYVENYKRKLSLEKVVELSALYETVTGKSINFLKDVKLY